MSVDRIASRYSKSFLELSKDQGKLEEVYSDIEVFTKALKSRDFYLMLKSPIINAGKKLSVLNAIFYGKLSDLTMSFFNLIVKKGRESYLPEIADNFIEQYRKARSISSVKLTSAAPLSDQNIEAIKKQLADSGVTHKNIEMDIKVDPSLIGGFVLEFDDRLYDASIVHKLSQLKSELGGRMPI